MFASSLPCTVRTVVVPCTWCGLIQGWPTGSLATAMVSQPATGAAGLPRSASSLPRSASSATSSGRSSVGKTPASAPHKQDKQGSWWASLRAALLPVPESTHAQRSGGMGSAQNAAAGSQLSAGPSAIAVRPAINERLQRVREATERQRAQAQDPDVFIPLSNDAEMFSGWLFKVSIGMITLPLAVWFLSTQLLVALCIKGLRSPDLYVVQLSLSRIQYYIFNETLAGWFEKDDGVVMLVSLLAHQAVLGDKGVVRDILATVVHLMKFSETRDALLLGMVTERLKRALDQGWVAREALEEAQLLYRSLEEAKQKHMEETYGRAAGAA